MGTNRTQILDGFDQAILKILQKDNTTSYRSIGESIHLSASAVQRRVKRLTDLGIIQANVAVLNSAKLGGRITLMVSVTLVNESAAVVESLKREFISHKEVQQCYYVTGSADFILIMVVESMESYEKFTKEYFFANHNIKRFTTTISMVRVKVGLEVPLD